MTALRFRPGLLATVGAALLLASGAALAQAPAQEFRIKAAFLLNFAKLVQWPATRFAGDADPVRICVLGQDPFGAALDTTVGGKRAGTRTIAVQRGGDATALGDCHIVYLGAAERPRYPTQLQALAGKHILTVDEGKTFQSLGMIRFYLEQDRVRFEINPAAIEQAGLALDPKMTQIGKIVTP